MAHKVMKLNLSLKELSLACPSDDVPGNSATLELQDKKLVCVEYPAVVNSVDRMLETLGGEQTVSNTFAHPNRRLELRFRPQDPFCHCLCGNRLSSSNLLLKVKRRTRKKDPKDARMHMEIVGVIGTTYKFQGMADFQCLAVHSENGIDKSLYDDIILRKPESEDFFQKPVPYFLPPAIFSRLDTPVDYYYRRDGNQKAASQMPSSSSTCIGLNRARRPNNAIFVSFSDATVPSEALEAAKTNWERMCVKDNDKQAEEHMKKMFENRPIWSRNAVKANINVHPDKLKLLLPLFAYYTVTGPWRSLWVRLGYDPRKIVESKMYQLLDFRIRCSTKHGYSFDNVPVKAKRSAMNYALSITVNKAGPQPASVMDLLPQEGPSAGQGSACHRYQLKESAYVFREGMLPPHRQMFYQLCDLHVDSIQKVIDQNKGQEQTCDERDGWCAIGTKDKLRDIISSMIMKVVRAQNPSRPERQKKRRRRSLKKDEEEDEDEDYENKDEEEEEEDDEFQPSEGSENEMETEMLDYM